MKNNTAVNQRGVAQIFIIVLILLIGVFALSATSFYLLRSQGKAPVVEEYKEYSEPETVYETDNYKEVNNEDPEGYEIGSTTLESTRETEEIEKELEDIEIDSVDSDLEELDDELDSI